MVIVETPYMSEMSRIQSIVVSTSSVEMIIVKTPLISEMSSILLMLV